MRSDEDEESADATDDETEVDEAKPKPPLGNIGPRALTWARAERWDTGLADYVPSKKRTRVGSMQQVDGCESDTYDAGRGYELGLSKHMQASADALGGIELSLVMNRTRRQCGARRVSDRVLSDTRHAIDEVNSAVELVAPSRPGHLGRYGNFYERSIGPNAALTGVRRVKQRDTDLGVWRRGSDPASMSTLARQRSGAVHVLGVTAIGKSRVVVTQVLTWLMEARRTHEHGGVVVVVAPLTTVVDHLYNDFAAAVAQLPVDDRAYAAVEHYRRDASAGDRTARILVRTHASTALPGPYASAPDGSKPLLLMVVDEDEKVIRASGGANGVYAQSAVSYLNLRDKAAKVICLGADFTSAPDYREFLRNRVDPTDTTFTVPTLTPAHVCRRILVFRDYDADLFACLLADLVEKALLQTRGKERPIFVAAAHRETLGNIGLGWMHMIPWLRQRKAPLRHRAFFVTIACTGAVSRSSKTQAVCDIEAVIEREAALARQRIRSVYPDWDGPLVPIVLFSRALECGMSMRVRPFGAVVLDGASDVAEALWQMLMRSGREQYAVDLATFCVMLLRSCGSDDALGRDEAEYAEGGVDGAVKREASRAKIAAEVMRSGRPQNELPVPTSKQHELVNARREHSNRSYDNDDPDDALRDTNDEDAEVPEDGFVRCDTLFQSIPQGDVRKHLRDCLAAYGSVNRDATSHVGSVLNGLINMGHGVALCSRANVARFKPKRLRGSSTHILHGKNGILANFGRNRVVSDWVVGAVLGRNATARMSLDVLPTTLRTYGEQCRLLELRNRKRDSGVNAEWEEREKELDENDKDVLTVVGWACRHVPDRVPDLPRTDASDVDLDEACPALDVLWHELRMPMMQLLVHPIQTKKTLHMRCLFAFLDSRQTWNQVDGHAAVNRFRMFCRIRTREFEHAALTAVAVATHLNALGILRGNPVGRVERHDSTFLLHPPSDDCLNLDLLHRIAAKASDDDVLAIRDRLASDRFREIRDCFVDKVRMLFSACGFELNLKGEEAKLVPSWPPFFVGTYRCGNITEWNIRRLRPACTQSSALISRAFITMTFELPCTGACFRHHEAQESPLHRLLTEGLVTIERANSLSQSTHEFCHCAREGVWHRLPSHQLSTNDGIELVEDDERVPWQAQDHQVASLQDLDPTARDALFNDAATAHMTIDALPGRLATELGYGGCTAVTELFSNAAMRSVHPDAYERACTRAQLVLRGKCTTPLGRAVRDRLATLRRTIAVDSARQAPRQLLALVAHHVMAVAVERAAVCRDNGLVGIMHGRLYLLVSDLHRIEVELKNHHLLPSAIHTLTSPIFTPTRHVDISVR